MFVGAWVRYLPQKKEKENHLASSTSILSTNMWIYGWIGLASHVGREPQTKECAIMIPTTKEEEKKRMNDIYAAKTWFNLHVATFRCLILAVLNSCHWISIALNFTLTEMIFSIHLIMHAICTCFFMMLSCKHTQSNKSVGLHKNWIRYHLQIEIGKKKK